VIDPETLVKEIDGLKAQGCLEDETQLRISPSAHVIMPYHRMIDQARERRLGSGKIGTTGRGIGPCYEDKVARRGIRVVDLLYPDRLLRLVQERLPEANGQLVGLGEKALTAEEVLAAFVRFTPRIRPFVGDTSVALAEQVAKGKAILFEGAQGTLLDVDHGTYPFVTSSNTTAAAAATGSGIGPRAIDHVVGISKAYATRVGGGPFRPSSTTTLARCCARRATSSARRPVAAPLRVARHSRAALLGADQWSYRIALTKLDVLTGLDPIRLCVAYELDGQRLTELPNDAETLAQVKPIYEDHPGWKARLVDVASTRTS